jgi:RHS repeat-associated protein
MKSWASSRCLSADIFAFILVVLSPTAFAAAGRTVGTYQVSPTGAATYTIPIWAPRGPAGVQPQITLTYNNQSGSGYLGVGWSLGGLSSIYRCTQTYAQDPAPAPITLTMSDVFCMDGQRLRLTGGTYGDPGSTYQTEVANFANVTAYSSAGNGPSYFEVQGRDGRTYEYGNGGGSQVLATGTSTAWVWWLDKVTDRAGNTMTISYSDANGTAVPVTISWTPSGYGSTTYNYTMTFGYGTNAPQSSTYAYVAGSSVSNTNLLSSISIEYTGTTVKKYSLSYQQSPTTGRDELTQVQECADAAQTNCLAPTAITYQNGSAGVSGTSSTSNLGGATSWYLAGYDLNRDGYKDLVYQLGTTWYVAFGSATGYGNPIDTGISTSSYLRGKATTLVGDLLGSGTDGLLANDGGTWYYYTWNGSSFVGVSTGVPYDAAASAFALADTNGDGLPDLVSLDLNVGGTSANVYVRLNTSSGATVGFGGANTAWTSPPTPGMTVSNGSLRGADYQHAVPVRRIDFDGDGREDLVVQVQWYDSADKIHASNAYQLLSQGTTFSGVYYQNPSAYYLNWNDDACTDFIGGGSLYLSTCNGQPGSTITLGETPVAVINWDGSGREDFLYDSGGYLYVQPSTGDGLGTPFSTGIAYNASATYMGADINGDGLDDLLTWVSGGSTLTYNLHNSGGQPPDLLNSVTDGYGNFEKPTYISVVQGVNSTYFEWNDAQYPYEDYLGPMYIVDQTTFSDPSSLSNGTYQVSYYYSGAWTNLQGRGFAGFGNFQTHDGRNGIWTTYGYGRAFPYTGIPSGVVATQNNTPQETIFNRSFALSDMTLSGTQYEERHFPYVSSWTESDYEVGGAKNGQLVTAKTGSLSYDGYGNLTSSSQTVTDEDGGSPYVGDSWTETVTNTPDVNTGSWCLSLLSESQISYSASDGSPPVTRTRQYTPDTTHCWYTGITTEPSSNTYEVAESLGYDSFGNIDSDTITGIGMAARPTTANWGATGQFPMSMTDPAGATTQFNYDFGHGLVSSETDPNGLTTSWTYGDGFGRVTQETRPDGTYTMYYYNACNSGNSYCGNSDKPDLRLFLQKEFFGSDRSLIVERDLYENSMGAVRVNSIYNLSGKTWVDTYYDALGRVVQKSMPHFSTEYDTTYSYDILNRVVQVQRPINQNDNTLQTTGYAYEGDSITITDPYNNTRTLVHDPNGWLRETKDALGYAVTLGYDAAGSKVSVSDNLSNGPAKPLWTGTYAYGVAPFLTGETDVDRGTWGFVVDALGERTAWTDPKGQHFSETYDALSRPTTRTEPDLFTQWTWGASAASHNWGKLAGVCTGIQSACSSSYYAESDTYDSLSRPYQRSITIPGMGTSIYTWAYNATTGFLDTLTYPVSTSGQALKLQYAYHTGLLQSITDVLDSPNVTVWKADAQTADDQISEETLGNGLVTNRAYDAVTGWLTSVQSGPAGGASVQNQSFLYDEMGNVTQRQDNDLGLSENFYYDNDYRLSYSTLNGSQNLSLSYDTMGNILSRSDVAGGAAWTYDPTHVHQVTEAGSSAYAYAYDLNGNMTSRQGSAITWTSYNYPNSINDTTTGETVYFSYGPDRRAWMEETQGSSGTETAYHVGGLLDIVSSGGVTDFRHYIYAGNEPVAIDSRKSNGMNAFYYLLSDQEGSVSKITDGSGAVVVGESFTAYGNRRNPTTWSGSPSGTDLTTIAEVTRHGYSFQDTLGQMGLNDMVGRVQDAITGRFLSADPEIPDPTDPQSYNRYSYVRNNPLTYTDPTGFTDESHQTEKENGLGYFDFGSGSTGGDSGSGAGGSGPVVVTALRDSPFDGFGPNWTHIILNGAYGQVTKPDGSSEGGTAAAQEGVSPKGHSNSGQSSQSQSSGNSQGDQSQQSNPTSPTVLPTVTVTATSPLQQVTTTAQYEYPLSEAPLGDGLLDLVRQILAELSRPPHEVLSPQDAGINFQTGHYINRVGPENVGPVEGTGEGIVNSPDFVPGTSVCFTCNGVNYEMRTYVLPDGTINVGTIFPIE